MMTGNYCNGDNHDHDHDDDEDEDDDGANDVEKALDPKRAQLPSGRSVLAEQ